MNHLITTVTGALITSTILDIPNPDAGRSVIVRPDGEESGIWNTSTLVFDPREDVVKITKEEFMLRFTDEELEDIAEAQDADKQIKGLFLKLGIVPDIEITSASILGVLTMLENKNLISAGRAEEMISG